MPEIGCLDDDKNATYLHSTGLDENGAQRVRVPEIPMYL